MNLWLPRSHLHVAPYNQSIVLISVLSMLEPAGYVTNLCFETELAWPAYLFLMKLHRVTLSELTLGNLAQLVNHEVSNLWLQYSSYEMYTRSWCDSNLPVSDASPHDCVQGVHNTFWCMHLSGQRWIHLGHHMYLERMLYYVVQGIPCSA